MPTSCEDLQKSGNNHNGFFSVLTKFDGVKHQNKKIKTVHCNFQKETDEPGKNPFPTVFKHNSIIIIFSLVQDLRLLLVTLMSNQKLFTSTYRERLFGPRV